MKLKFATTVALIFALVALPTRASDLQILSFSGPLAGAANTNVSYSLQIQNSGPETTNASLLISPLHGQTFQSLTKPASWTCNTPSVNAAGDVTCTNTAFAKTTAWVANEVVALNEFRFPTTPNGHWYKATTAGTTHSTTEPTWNLGSGSTTSDGSVVWTEQGTDTFTLTVKIPSGTTLWTWTQVLSFLSFTPTSTSPPDPTEENDWAYAPTRVNG